MHFIYWNAQDDFTQHYILLNYDNKEHKTPMKSIDLALLSCYQDFD